MPTIMDSEQMNTTKMSADESNNNNRDDTAFGEGSFHIVSSSSY